jgi:hypothetical protein
LSALAASVPPARRDYYTEFIEGSRWLRKEQADARTAWFAELKWEHKERTLFRFEMLLKGLVCFGNPANHPGTVRRDEPIVARDFAREMEAVRAAVRSVVEIGRALSGDVENTSVFQRYVESVVAQDHARIQMARRALNQDTPQQSITLLVAALRDLLDVLDGLPAGAPVPFRLFAASIRLAQREIHRSEFFDPLASLEFRAEFDRIRSPVVLEVIAGIESDPSRRVAALTFLSLFRLLRYIDLVDEEQAKISGFGTLFAFLALLRSDAEALATFFAKDSSTWIADGFGREFEACDPAALTARFATLGQEFSALKSLRELLESLGNQLKLELRKVYEQQIPALSTVEDQKELTNAIERSTSAARSFIQNAIVLLVQEFRAGVEGEAVFEDFTSNRARSERLRRDVWMFQQILRAFIEKAKGSTAAADQWAGMSTFRFVREFVSYFKSMGYQLLRYADFARFDEFMRLVEQLRDGDVLEEARLAGVVRTCEDFNGFLEQMFEAVGRRAELADLPFDRRDAARTLKLFLGH